MENKVEMLRINKISDKANCVFGAENVDRFKRKGVGNEIQKEASSY